MSRPCPPSPRSGFTLLEVVVSSAVLVVGLLALGSSTLRIHNLREHTVERRLAENALRGISEEIRGASRGTRRDADWLAALVARYGPGAPGASFAVEGLTPADGADAVGTIQLVLDERVGDADLGVALGLPRDLNGDGDDDDADVGATATLVPVVVRLAWSSDGATRRATHGFYLLGFGQ